MVLELFDVVLELFDLVVSRIGAIGRFILIVLNGPRMNRIDRSARSANYSDWSECQIGTDRCGPGSCSSGSWNKSGWSVWSVCSDEQVVDVGLGCVRSLRADRHRIGRSLDSDHSDEQGVDVGLGCVRSLRADRHRIGRSLDSDHSDEQGVDVGLGCPRPLRADRHRITRRRSVGAGRGDPRPSSPIAPIYSSIAPTCPNRPSQFFTSDQPRPAPTSADQRSRN